MKSNERTVLFFDLVISSYSRTSKSAPTKTAYELAEYLHGAFTNGYAVQQYKKGVEWIYIADMQPSEDGTKALILINKTDKLGADNTVYNPIAKRRRFFKKEEGEGNEHSAHIVWDLEKSPPHGRHKFLLELATGLSSAQVVSFLNRIFMEIARRHRKEFEAPHLDGSKDKNGNPRMVSYRPKVELHGHLSDSFIDDLQQGSISYIEVYTESEKYEHWDDGGFTREQRKSVFVKAEQELSVMGKNVAALKSVLKRGEKDQYEYARVVFRTSDNLGRTVRLETATSQLVNDFQYVKKAKIDDFDVVLRTSYDRIYSPILGKMIELI